MMEAVQQLMNDAVEEMKRDGEILSCFGCGEDVLNHPKTNVYYDFPKHCEGHTICNKCLDYMLNVCMNPPSFVMSPKGPIRLTNDLVLPFSPNVWINIRCRCR